MSPFVEVGIEGSLGTITLNRPAAINALDRGMIDGIAQTLEAWQHDAEVRAVLFEGRGSRGFCSGGDVRAMRDLVIAGRNEEAHAFFAAEYAMNGLIANYRKPVVAITDGVVMGGGIGIAGHAAFRFTTPDARYAMPEAAIGFVSDVGVNYILARAPEARALAFLMTGLPVRGADALSLGLADCTVLAERRAEVRSGIAAAAEASSVETALVSLMQAESIQPGLAEFCVLADRLSDCFAADDAAEIVAAVADAAAAEPAFAPIAEALASRSPTSLEAILQSHRTARTRQQVEAVLALDLRLARLLSGLPDFAEGVRAQLVDKDQKPRWQPADFAEVPKAKIAAAMVAE
ncbi:MAG TPA: enoyl-CoA hydratase/isomerase family protein [Devosiaceae bacterium]|nr:enoyl-CoA hydratase/isomerase family protein [Devosiaceae bacterium]